MLRFIIDLIVAALIAFAFDYNYGPFSVGGYCLLIVVCYIVAFIVTRSLKFIPDILEAIFD